MSPTDQPSSQHHVGITNAQENNPDVAIAELTRRMNVHFNAGEYAEAGTLALEITARSKDELAATLQEHGVSILHLDHEAFGIYEGQIEPTYDLHVEGTTPDILAAATEFGTHHAQEMVLIARKLQEGDSDPDQRLGVTITLNSTISVEEAAAIAVIVRACGFQGATFAPKKNGTVIIYHTENLGLSPEEFQQIAMRLTDELKKNYISLQYRETFHILILVRL